MKVKKIPMRMCIACHEMNGKKGDAPRRQA